MYILIKKRTLRFFLSVGIIITPGLSYSQTSPSTELQTNVVNPGGGSTSSDYTKLTEILPPSPDAASLGKYGGQEIGLTSGIPNVSIPLYSYVSNNLKLPISLSYSSNGLKVDEIASRVGMSWSLNAGGVVTRIVMGAADEQTQRLATPADFPQRTQNLITFLETLNVRDANDAEPDIFSFNFNGYTGKFLLDNNLNPILLNHSALRIQKDFSATGMWNFKITTPNGEQYFFGGPSATETTNKYQSGCGKSYPSFVPTAWYLKQVIHPNQDTLNFKYGYIGYNYKTGVSEAMYGYSGNYSLPQGAAYSPSGIPNTSCLSWLLTSTVYLQEITSTSGGKLKFLYKDRPDIGDKLLNLIEVYQQGKATPFKYFNLDYRFTKASGYANVYTNADTSLKNRPFLIGVTERGTSGTDTKVHQFSYNRLESLPPRLSYAQDAYGYFNGANNSTTLIPHPAYDDWQHLLPNATADRNSNALSTTIGLLNKIRYPTGGFDSLVYEGNTNYQQLEGSTPKKTIYLTGVGVDMLEPKTLTSPTFQLSANKSAKLHAECVYDPHSGMPADQLHNKCTINVFDVTAGTTIFTQILSLGQIIDIYEISLRSGHSYQLQIIPRGAAAQASANFSYPDDTYIAPYDNVVVGGLRISKVITTTAGNDNPAQIKHYYYYNPDDPTKSSGSRIYRPQFEKYLHVYSQSLTTVGGPICEPTIYDYYSMYSNSQTNLYAYSTPINYTSVLESFGDNFENGGIEHHFELQADIPGQSILGEPMPSAPLSDYTWKNGRETNTFTFKMNGTVKVPVQKVFTHYKEDTRVSQEYKSYIVNKKYTPTCETSPPNQTQFDAYDLISYSHFRKWVYVDSITTWLYDQNGQNYTELLNTYTYGNQNHAMVTRETATNSDGGIDFKTTSYPYDLTLTGDEETARLALINRYMIGVPLRIQNYKNSTLLNTDRIKYYVFSNNLVLPRIYNVQTQNNAAEDRVVFDSYDNYGNLLQQRKAGGPFMSYQWGYNKQYPVAEAKKAQSDEMMYYGFEEPGGWDALLSAYDTNFKHSGLASGRIDNTAATERYCLYNNWLNISLGSPKSYHYSGWVYSNGPTVDIFLFMKRAGETGYSSYVDHSSTDVRGKWVYVEKDFMVPADVKQLSLRIDNNGMANGGSQVWFDDLRLCPTDAQMTTYTFDPLVGMTSSMDAKGEPTYYEYDGFQRLISVKDKDGKIIRQTDYHYQGQ